MIEGILDELEELNERNHPRMVELRKARAEFKALQESASFMRIHQWDGVDLDRNSNMYMERFCTSCRRYEPEGHLPSCSTYLTLSVLEVT